MKAIEDFTNALQAIAEDKTISKDEKKKRLLSLADRMDKAKASLLEKLAYKTKELIDEYPNNIDDVVSLMTAIGEEDWLKVEKATKPLLDIKRIREISIQAGITPSV